MTSVFIVDDSQLFVEELEKTVPWNQFGCEVVGTANDAESAERMIRLLQPDIVITDICMSDRDGLELIDALADLDNIEFVLISAFSRFEYAQKAIRLNVSDYFVKPIDDEEFYSAISRLAQRIRERKQTGDGGNPPSAGISSSRESFLDQAVRYIDLHYSDELSAAEVANACFISESYLSKLFRKKLDTSFSEYLNFIRIEKAKALLKNTDLMIYEIAEKTGFNTDKYFTMVFKKLTGITPRQYKQNHEEDRK